MENLYSNRFITIEYDSENHWLYTNWENIQTADSVVNGGTKMIQYLKEKECNKVLNDNRLLKGTWTFASDYIDNQWFPDMINAGLKHFAWIQSPDIFSQFSMDKIQAIQKGGIIKIFDDLEESKAWLKSA